MEMHVSPVHTPFLEGALSSQVLQKPTGDLREVGSSRHIVHGNSNHSNNSNHSSICSQVGGLMHDHVFAKPRCDDHVFAKPLLLPMRHWPGAFKTKAGVILATRCSLLAPHRDPLLLPLHEPLLLLDACSGPE